MTSPDPFDTGVPRGAYNRPLIIPLDTRGKPKLKAALVEYDRASSVAGALDDGKGLAKWQTNHAVVGVSISPDLAKIIAALGPNPDLYDTNEKATLADVIDRAHDRSGGNVKADYGTAVHSLSEPGSDGVAVDDNMATDVQAYQQTIEQAGIEVEVSERFVVCDELQVAGTFDHIYRLTKALDVNVNGQAVHLPADTRLIGDKKTGSLHFDDHAIQEAIYAHGAEYDHHTGQRTPLGVSTEWGVVAHIPREGGKATLHLVDIAAGWEAAKMARQVRDWKLGAKKRLSTPFATATAPAPQVVDVEPVKVIDEPAQPVDPFGGAIATLHRAGLAPTDLLLDEIRQAIDADTCRALWSKHRGAWQDHHTDAVKARLAELGRTAA